MSEVEISLFPIPGVVSLPFTMVPLHVFEPRYRKMISDSIEQNRRIGVAHTVREISAAKGNEGLTEDEALSTNQETYEPHSIFSAGFAEILDTLPDGRMLVRIKMEGRYEIVDEIQQLPYRIVRCRPFEDDAEVQSEGEESIDALRTELDTMLLNLPVPNFEKLKEHLASEKWKSQSTEQFSFSIFQLVIFEPETLQRVLELKSAADRISFLRDALKHPLSQ